MSHNTKRPRSLPTRIMLAGGIILMLLFSPFGSLSAHAEETVGNFVLNAEGSGVQFGSRTNEGKGVYEFYVVNNNPDGSDPTLITVKVKNQPGFEGDDDEFRDLSKLAFDSYPGQRNGGPIENLDPGPWDAVVSWEEDGTTRSHEWTFTIPNLDPKPDPDPDPGPDPDTDTDPPTPVAKPAQPKIGAIKVHSCIVVSPVTASSTITNTNDAENGTYTYSGTNKVGSSVISRPVVRSVADNTSKAFSFKAGAGWNTLTLSATDQKAAKGFRAYRCAAPKVVKTDGVKVGKKKYKAKIFVNTGSAGKICTKYNPKGKQGWSSLRCTSTVKAGKHVVTISKVYKKSIRVRTYFDFSDSRAPTKYLGERTVGR